MAKSRGRAGQVVTIGAVPAAVVAFYEALDGRNPEDAAQHAAESVLFAAPERGASDSAPRMTTVGRGALADRLRARGAQSYRHEVRLAVTDGVMCLVEGVTTEPNGATLASFAGSVRLDADGLISRYLALAFAPAVEVLPSATSTGRSPDPASVVDRYFGAMERADFAEAAALFSADVVYDHPPYEPGGDRVTFRGRSELLRGFENRGSNDSLHPIVALASAGSHTMLEGLHTNRPDGGEGSFVSSLSFDDEGLISRYVAWYCDTAVAVSP